MKKLPLCFICRTEPCRSPVASVCSLQCACLLNGDDYEAVKARLDDAVKIAGAIVRAAN